MTIDKAQNNEIKQNVNGVSNGAETSLNPDGIISAEIATHTLMGNDIAENAHTLDVSGFVSESEESDIKVNIRLSNKEVGTLAYQLEAGENGVAFDYDESRETLTIQGDAGQVQAMLATLVFLPNTAVKKHFALNVSVETSELVLNHKVAMLYDGDVQKHVAVHSPYFSSGRSAVIRPDLVELTIAEYGEITPMSRLRLRRLANTDKQADIFPKESTSSSNEGNSESASADDEALFHEMEQLLFQFAESDDAGPMPVTAATGNQEDIQNSGNISDGSEGAPRQDTPSFRRDFNVTPEESIDRSTYINELDTGVTLLENTINAGAVILDTDVRLEFDTSQGINGALVRVGYTSHSPGAAEDQLSIKAGGPITIAGNNIVWQGNIVFAQIIGDGVNGRDLEIQFNALAKGFMANILLQNLAYQNTSDTPITTRKLTIFADDAQGHATALKILEITIVPEADPLGFVLTGAVDNFTAQHTDDNFTANDADFQAADVLVGGTGLDTLIFNDAVNGALGDWANKTGIDVITLNADGSVLTLSDAFVDASDSDSVLINNQSHVLTLNSDDLNNARDAVIGGTGTVTLANVRNRVLVSDSVDGNVQGGTNRDTIIAGDGNDSIRGGSSHDSIIGGGGADTLRGDNHNDTMRGGTGDDVLRDDHGNDRLFGDAGDDDISSGASNDILYGGTGNDTVDGGNNNDSLWGQEGNDTMRGGNHNDTLYGGIGADTMRGDSGTDFFVYKALDESTATEMDIIEDFSVTVEKLIFTGLNLKYLANSAFSGVADQVRWYQSGGNTFVEADGDGDMVADFVTRLNGNINLSVDQFVGITDQSGDDTLVLTANANDVVAGTGGTDTITTTNAHFHLGDSINGEGDIDVVVFTDAANFTQADLANKSNIERIELNANGNVVGISYALVNVALNRDFFLDNQNFTIIELDASGLNNSRQLFIEGSGQVTLKDGVSNYLYYKAGVTANLTGGTGDDRVFTSATGNMHDRINAGDGDDSIRTYSGNDSLLGGLGNDSLVADNGNDTLYGGDGSDTLLGGNNHDRLYGEDGNDSLHGGRNNDTIWGGDGDDTIFGDREYDLLYGEAGNDSINAAQHNDTVYGGAGNDTIYGHNNNDSLFGDADDDYIHGGRHNDTLYGGTGNDTLYGEREHDWLFGEAGNDTLFGHNNNDTLVGGDGVDTLTGGANTDSYVFENNTDSGIGVGNRDIITDFSAAQGDKIVLSNFGFGGGAAYVGNAAFANGGALEVRYAVSGADAILELNTDGLGGTDLEIELLGIDGTTLLATDFVW